MLHPTLPAHCLITSTLPTEAAAERIAEAVVRERLAACAQVSGPVHSTYRWQGAVEQASEWSLQCKTTGARAPALLERIRTLHPYEVPEIVATPVLAGHSPYLAWVRDSVAEP